MTDDLAQELDRTTTLFDDALIWLATTAPTDRPPLAAEVWVFDPGLRQILLVQHRWRGWVPPGGKVEAGESPRAAAARELFEETGLRLELHPEPAAATVRCYQAGAPPTLGLSYVATAAADVRLIPESGQPVAWMPLAEEWSSWFPDDPARVRAHAARLRIDDEQRTIADFDISHRREAHRS